MLKLFLWPRVSPDAVRISENDLHSAFLAFEVVSLIAVVVTAFNLKQISRDIRFTMAVMLHSGSADPPTQGMFAYI